MATTQHPPSTSTPTPQIAAPSQISAETIKPRSTYSIRPGRESDIPHLADIERSAGQLFRTVGLDAVADDEPMPVEVLRVYLGEGNLWVAVQSPSVQNENPANQNLNDQGGKIGEEGNESRESEEGEVVAFLTVFPLTVTGTLSPPTPLPSHSTRSKTGSKPLVLLHIAEVSVHASHHRRGLGKRLMRHLEDIARSREQVSALSLTTYTHLAFNGPFYEALGYKQLPSDQIEEQLGRRAKELWDEEQGAIMNPEKRGWYMKWL
jgi:ribosomal protein S18 acetylase RimI-like enzyme